LVGERNHEEGQPRFPVVLGPIQKQGPEGVGHVNTPKGGRNAMKCTGRETNTKEKWRGRKEKATQMVGENQLCGHAWAGLENTC